MEAKKFAQVCEGQMNATKKNAPPRQNCKIQPFSAPSYSIKLLSSSLLLVVLSLVVVFQAQQHYAISTHAHQRFNSTGKFSFWQSNTSIPDCALWFRGSLSLSGRGRRDRILYIRRRRRHRGAPVCEPTVTLLCRIACTSKVNGAHFICARSCFCTRRALFMLCMCALIWESHECNAAVDSSSTINRAHTHKR